MKWLEMAVSLARTALDAARDGASVGAALDKAGGHEECIVVMAFELLRLSELIDVVEERSQHLGKDETDVVARSMGAFRRDLTKVLVDALRGDEVPAGDGEVAP